MDTVGFAICPCFFVCLFYRPNVQADGRARDEARRSEGGVSDEVERSPGDRGKHAYSSKVLCNLFLFLFFAFFGELYISGRKKSGEEIVSFVLGLTCLKGNFLAMQGLKNIKPKRLEVETGVSRSYRSTGKLQ